MKNLTIFMSIFLFAFALNAHASYRGCGDCGDSRDRDNCCPDTEVRIDNRANIKNDVDARANTGHNDANRNGRTGAITTGNAFSNGLSDIYTNGSDVTVDATWRGETNVGIRNQAMLRNDVSSIADTGNNVANENGGSVGNMSKCHPRVTVTRSGSGEINTGRAESMGSAWTEANMSSVKIRR